MLHPSYTELMNIVNEDYIEHGEIPVVNSRYSIVIATAKRARQLIAGEEPLVKPKNGRHLSTAVEELNEGKIKIMPSDVEEDTEEASIDFDMEQGTDQIDSYEE